MTVATSAREGGSARECECASVQQSTRNELLDGHDFDPPWSSRLEIAIML